MKKKTFFDLYRAYDIGKWEMAREAKVELEVINLMLVSEPVARDDAIKVLNVISRWVGVRYTFEDIYINLRESTSYKESPFEE